MKLPIDVDGVKGFLDPSEGRRLYELALEASTLGPVLEIGSYCGKSTVYLGAACREKHGVMFAVDHHRGSEEHQVGEAFHDPELVDAATGSFNSFPAFLQTLLRAGLEETVVAVVAPSALVARGWRTPLGMVFIDGGHSLQAAMNDYRSWVPQLLPGGILAIHDVFEDPAEGGRPPYEIYRLACASGLFAERDRTMTLRVLQRIVA